jgi:hypothetical protein
MEGENGGSSFSWLDFASGDLPPNPFTAIPQAYEDLCSDDYESKKKALAELKQFDGTISQANPY